MSSLSDDLAATSIGYAVVGVVGHIDHGKTSLVAALTGVDTDTHPEEKRRGITIDLGFAHLRTDGWQLAFIDAPGHQKYIGNLLAGVSKLDVGLLVVASDQGIQEQTLEHVAILRMLGVEDLIVVISRVDLASSDQQQELAEELELFLGEYGFHDFPIVHASIKDAASVDRLRTQLVVAAERRVRRKIADAPFRMPVDRIFTVEGRGCVVAGVVWSGAVVSGDQLEIPRLDAMVRVRDLESHDEPVASATAGRRVAVNLSGVSARDLHRGDELVTPGYFQSSRRYLAAIRLFPDAAAVACPAVAQMHTATTHCEARIVGTRTLAPGDTCYGIIEATEPLIATHGQLALLRRPYPIGSFAGATLLCGLDGHERQQKSLLKQAEALASAEAGERLAAWVEVLGEWRLNATEARQALGIDADQLDDDGLASELVRTGRLLRSGDTLMAPSAVERSQRYLLKLLTEAAASDDAWVIEPALIQRANSTGSAAVVEAALHRLLDAKQAVRLNDRVAIASDATRLSKRQRARMADLLESLAGKRMPPTLKDLAKELGEPMEMLVSLGRFATQQGLLVELSPGLLMASEVFRQLLAELNDALANGAQRTASELKEHLQLSRKYAIPFLELCDKQGYTIRQGDLRTLGEIPDELSR